MSTAETRGRNDYRGSRKHVLDWVETPRFLEDLQTMLQLDAVVIPANAKFMPSGYAAPLEARLDKSRSDFEVLRGVREELRDWWLEHRKGANTPNWDLVVECLIEGRPGLVLVEAKANWPELKTDGKPKPTDVESRSAANHAKIEAAINEARAGLYAAGCKVSITIDTQYQLANRVAFMWKLASLGIPTVLVYLGFTGDENISDAGEPFRSGKDWDDAFGNYARGIVPSDIISQRLVLGSTPAWLLVCSRPVIEQSPPPKGN
jgi:hypothetical protein